MGMSVTDAAILIVSFSVSFSLFSFVFNHYRFLL